MCERPVARMQACNLLSNSSRRFFRKTICFLRADDQTRAEPFACRCSARAASTTTEDLPTPQNGAEREPSAPPQGLFTEAMNGTFGGMTEIPQEDSNRLAAEAAHWRRRTLHRYRKAHGIAHPLKIEMRRRSTNALAPVLPLDTRPLAHRSLALGSRAG